MSDKEIAFLLLTNTCGRILANREVHPKDIFNIAYDYLFGGCKSREDYEYLVSYCCPNPTFRKELLK